MTGKARGWATGGLGSPAKSARPDAAPGSLSEASAADAGELVAPWLPTIGRMLLGLVFVWFGWHEVVLPGRWTQYVPVIAENSRPATVLVAVHGWVLLGLAAALLPRGTTGIVASVVRVNDEAASRVMLALHASLRQGGSLAEALRDARRAVADDPLALAAGWSFVALGA